MQWRKKAPHVSNRPGWVTTSPASRVRRGRSEAEAAYVSALADTEYAREQEAAAARAVTGERRLRRALIAGDVQEQLYRARFNYYQAAQQRLEQWARLQNAAVDLARFGYPLVPTPLPLPDRMASTLQEAPAAAPSLAARTQPATQTAAGLAVTSGAYLWNSHSTLADPDAAVMAGGQPVSAGFCSVLMAASWPRPNCLYGCKPCWTPPTPEA